MARVQIDRRRTPEDTGQREARAVWDALHTPLPIIDPKYFYDDRGSELFEQITTLEEYYQTRTERRLLQVTAGDIVDAARPHEMVEFGSGASGRPRRALARRRRATMGACLRKR